MPTAKGELLVVGASGFVGRHLFTAARQAGYSVVGTQASSRQPGLLTFDLRTTRISDAFTPKSPRNDAPAWACICAGIANVDACARDPQESRLINVTNTERLIDDLTERGFRIVYFSTSAVFDGRGKLYDESATPAPLHEYGRQKAEVEQHVLANHPSALVVRLSKVLGTDPVERHLLSEWAERVRQDRALECLADESFSPTEVDDVATAILSLIEFEASGLFHVVNQECFRRDELACLFLNVCSREAPVVHRPPEYFGFTEPRPACSCLSNAKLVRTTGMRFTPVSAMLRRFCDRLENAPHR